MKQLKYMALALAVGASSVLTGCSEDFENPADTAADNADIDSQTRTKMASEERELKEELKKLQDKDPSVKDMYYSYNDKGEKQVNVVREVKDEKTGESKMAETVIPMMAGMMLGQMMANNMMMTAMMMSNSGGYNNTRYYSQSEQRKRRNTAVAGYATGTRNSVSRSFVSSRPSSAFSTRSTGALSGGSSARAGGYSAGG
ncbi:hypothetical protein D3C80_440240 [compost metagenome]